MFFFLFFFYVLYFLFQQINLHLLQKWAHKTWGDMWSTQNKTAAACLSSPFRKYCGAAAVAVLTGAKRREHVPDVLTSPPPPPVHTRIDFKLVSLVHKAQTDLASQCMLDLLKSEEATQTSQVTCLWSSWCTEGSNQNMTVSLFISLLSCLKFHLRRLCLLRLLLGVTSKTFCVAFQ